MRPRTKALLICARDKDRQALRRELEARGWTAEEATTEEQAKTALDENQYPLVFLDLRMFKGVGGAELVRKAGPRPGRTVVVVAPEGHAGARAAQRAGAQGAIPDPVTGEAFMEVLARSSLPGL